VKRQKYTKVRRANTMPLPLLGILGIIVGAVVVGALVTYAVILTVKWLRDKIKDMIARKNAEKVLVTDIENLVKNCTNKKSLDELNKLVDEGYEFVAVAVDDTEKNIVGDVTLIKDLNDELDYEVEQLLGNQRMVVIEQ